VLRASSLSPVKQVAQAALLARPSLSLGNRFAQRALLANMLSAPGRSRALHVMLENGRVYRALLAARAASRANTRTRRARLQIAFNAQQAPTRGAPVRLHA